MKSCIFCNRSPAALWALTSCLGEPKDPKSWQRAILPVCSRCNRLLDEGGPEGRVQKATAVRWYGGHNVGIFESKGAPGGGT